MSACTNALILEGIVISGFILTLFFSGDLSHDERLDYVNAVLCLQSLPPRTPANVSAGARSRVRCCWTERDWIIEDISDFLIGSLTISL